MRPYIYQVRQQQIEKICQSIKLAQQNDQKIYVSVVAYRDRTDDNCVEKIDFTENLDEFQTLIRQLNYNGGGYQCEDIKIGLEEVIKLEWKQNALNLLIWIEDSPYHGKEFHDNNVSDQYPEDNGEDLKKLFEQICDLDVDIYFYKINDSTNQMIQILKKSVFEYDKKLSQEYFEDTNFSKHALKNYFNSQSDSAFGEFFKYVKQLAKTKQLQKEIQIKQQIKDYQQKIILQQDHLKSKDSILYQCLQETEIENMDDIQYNNQATFISYKFKLNKNPNIIEQVQKEEILLQVSTNIIGQGAFKETFLAQDQQDGNMYALKKFKDSNQFDFDNFLIKYFIQLTAENIRDSFISQFKKETADKSQQNELKIFFDKQFIVQDQLNKQFNMMELVKNGFKKYINNDLRQFDNQKKSQQELFQSFLHYSFEYSSYDFTLSDIQGFGNTLNDISIHSQSFISNFKVNEKPQLFEQFQLKQSMKMEDFQINTPIYSNLGNIGIALFFNQHQCNKYCKLLKLKTFDSFQSQTIKFKENKTE
ncbi:hypothetical protein ABPG72_010884 [Tetrahymena utriculariae]